jgi:BirA family biotin operon repressor/biotin-[acetyl-CoA-carboxylase] ligase
MTKPKKLTPKLIRQIITGEEIPLRRRSFEPETVDEVLRYGAIVGSVIEQHALIPRGMDRARELIRHAEEAGISFASGTVILADEMMQSKGRFQRTWHAPQGGLWLTLVLVNTLLPESSLLLPLAAGIACCEVMRDYGITAYIKWVNDVLADGKKISGILAETCTGSHHGEEYVLIGIGINVNNDTFPPELSTQATSVKSCLQQPVCLATAAARLVAKLRWNIGLLYYEEAGHLEIHGGIGGRNMTWMENMPGEEHLLLQSYKILTDIYDRRVLFGFNVRDKPQFEARVVGLDNCGGLILELDDGARMIQRSGEISYLD